MPDMKKVGRLLARIERTFDPENIIGFGIMRDCLLTACADLRAELGLRQTARTKPYQEEKTDQKSGS